jgi:hypothetical protein
VDADQALPPQEQEVIPSQEESNEPSHSEPCQGEPEPDKATNHNPLWDNVLQELALQMPSATYNTWVRDTWILEHTGDAITIGTPNAFAIDWLQNRLSHKIRRMLSCMLSQSVHIQFKVAPRLMTN